MEQLFTELLSEKGRGFDWDRHIEMIKKYQSQWEENETNIQKSIKEGDMTEVNYLWKQQREIIENLHRYLDSKRILESISSDSTSVSYPSNQKIKKRTGAWS